MASIFLVIPIAVLVTATISGVFGMGGGMILMGVYVMLLPVPAAMVLHGATQLASNGYRAVLLRRHFYWPALVFYGLGAMASLALFTWLTVTLDRAAVLLVLGGVPLSIALFPLPRLTIESPRLAVLCGFVVNAASLVAGVSGPLLDIFFLKGSLTRYQIIGTKAVTQSFSHALKLVYFTMVVPSQVELPLWIYPVVVSCALLGTRIGRRLLESLSELRFRRWSTGLVMAIAVLYMARGIRELLAG